MCIRELLTASIKTTCVINISIIIIITNHKIGFAGENLLALVKTLANSPYLADPGEYRHGSVVFFDVVGLFMVLYPARLGVIINTVTVATVIITALRRAMGRTRSSGNQSSTD